MLTWKFSSYIECSANNVGRPNVYHAVALQLSLKFQRYGIGEVKNSLEISILQYLNSMWWTSYYRSCFKSTYFYKVYLCHVSSLCKVFYQSKLNCHEKVHIIPKILLSILFSFYIAKFTNLIDQVKFQLRFLYLFKYKKL